MFFIYGPTTGKRVKFILFLNLAVLGLILVVH